MKSYCYFIATSWNEGAISVHFRTLAEELTRRGHKVVILVDHQKYNVENHKSNPVIYTWPSFRPTKLSDAIFLFKLIRKYHPNCLIANFGSVNIMMAVGWLLKVPVRIAFYHTLSDEAEIEGRFPKYKIKFLRIRKGLVYKLTTHLVGFSEAAIKDLNKTFKIPIKKCSIFHYLLMDPYKYLSSKEKKIENKIVCVAKLSVRKAQDILIRACAILKDYFPNIKVEFIGDGPFKVYLSGLTKELKLEDTCFFLGSLSHSKVFEKLSEAYISILPSRSEAFGLVIIESLAVGTPVVASSVGGIPEIIRDGIDGFLVPPDNPEALAQKIKILLLDPELRERMSKNARQRFLEKFEQTKAIKEQVDWLEKIVIKNKSIKINYLFCNYYLVINKKLSK